MGSSGGGKRLRVAMFTPLPPAHTGTADYAAALIPELGKLVELEVFDTIPRRNVFDRFDVLLYQIGNNPFHADMYNLALEHPGVVVLHEPNVHDLLRGMLVNRQEAYIGEILFEIFGEEAEAIPEHARRKIGPQPRVFTMIKRLLSRNKGAIAHSRFVEGQIRIKGFNGPVATIPHGASLDMPDSGAYRRSLGIGPEQPLLGMFGYLRPEKQIYESLGVFKLLLEKYPDARMLIVGEPHPEVPIERRLKALGIESQVHVLVHQTMEDFDGYLAACDVVLNLRWPTYGETSGTMMRAFGMGRAVVVSDLGSDRELSDEICVRIPCDQYQDRVLLESLEWLLSDRAITTQIGRSAREWVARECTWPRVARMYADFLQSVAFPEAPKGVGDIRAATALQRFLRQWVTPESESARHLDDQMARLTRTVQLIPPGTADERILEMGCYMQITPALKRLSGYGEVRGCYLGSGVEEEKTLTSRDGEVFTCAIDLFDAEAGLFPYPSNRFHAVVCGHLIEYLYRDPMAMMSEIYRILKPGGALVLTTPNAVSLNVLTAVLHGDQPFSPSRFSSRNKGEQRIARVYTPAEVSQLLRDAGFQVVHIETGPNNAESVFPSWAVDAAQRSGSPRKLRGECIFGVGRKAAIPRNRYPNWLYEC